MGDWNNNEPVCIGDDSNEANISQIPVPRNHIHNTHLDVIKIGRLLESRLIPIKILQPPIYFGIVMSDHACTLEVASVDTIISNDGSIQTDVCLSESVANEVVFALEDVIKPAKGLVKGYVIGFIGALC